MKHYLIVSLYNYKCN